MRIALFLALAFGWLATAASAQDSPGFVGGLIEDSLSAPGREVRVEGFSGALSGAARIDRMTFADDEGVWLTLENVALDWNRAALLRRRLSVEALTAEQLTISRRPNPPEQTLPEPPKAEASGFSLPELPVSVRIGTFGIERVDLGEPVLGTAAQLKVEGSATLADGDGSVRLATTRLDGPEDRITLEGAFSNESGELSVDLAVVESAGGLVGKLLNIPGNPAIDFSVAGSGPLDAFDADIRLASAGEERVTGTVALRGTDVGGTRFTADIAGDVSSLVVPAYQDFFGPDVALSVAGVRSAEGALDLQTLEASARSLSLSGSAQIAADGLPTRFALTGAIRDPGGARVRLPVAAPASVQEIALTAAFDAAEGDSWRLDLDIAEPEFGDWSAAALLLSGTGRIVPEAGSRAVTADLDYAVRGFDHADSGLVEALGTEIAGNAVLSWAEGGPLAVSELTLGGTDYGFQGNGNATFANRTVSVSGEATVEAEDLSRFSSLAGRPLTGSARIALTGEGDPVGGIFSAALDLDGEGLSIGQEIVDRLIDGPVTLSTALSRDTTGTALERFRLDSPGVTAEGNGALGPVGSALDLRVTLTDLGLIDPRYEGPVTLAGRVAEPAADTYDLDVTLEGPYGIAGSVVGQVGPSARGDLRLDLGLPDIAPLVPQYTGPVRIQGTAQQSAAAEGAWDVDLGIAGPYESTVALQGVLGGGVSDITLDAGLPDIAPFAPGFTGTVAIDGTAAETGDGRWQVDLDVAAPYDAQVALQGAVGDGRSDLTLSASLPDIAPLAPGLTGGVTVDGTAAETGEGRWQVDLDVGGPYESQVALQGAVGDGRGDLALSAEIPDIAPFAPGFTGAVSVDGTAAQTPDAQWQVDLKVDGPYEAEVAVVGVVGDGRSALRFDGGLPDIAPLVQGFTGALSFSGTAGETGEGRWAVDVEADAPYGAAVQAQATIGDGRTEATLSANVPDLAPIVPAVRGPVSLDAQVAQAEGGLWDVTAEATAPGRSTASITGRAGAENSDLAATVRVGDVSAFAPGLSGASTIEARARQDADAVWLVEASLAGPYNASASVDGRVGPGVLAGTVDASVPDISPIVPGLRGGVTLDADLRQDGDAWEGTVEATGPASATLSARGRYGPGQTNATLSAALPDIGPFAPGLSGPLRVDATVTEPRPQQYSVVADVAGPYSSTARIDATLAPGTGSGSADLRVNIPNIAPLAPGLSGPLTVTGTARENPSGWALDLTVDGPGTARSRVAGTAATNFSTVDLSVTGSAPLALANQILAPNQIDGTLTFDLQVRGTPGLGAVSGTVSTSGARLALPTLGQTLNDISARATLNGGSATIDVRAASANGGTVSVSGPIRIAGGPSADLQITISSFVLEDPNLYSTTLNGGIRVSGPLTGGGTISGRIDVGRTEIQIPSGGLGFGGAIPPMRHVNEPSAVRLTRIRAGATDTASGGGNGGGNGGGGPVFGLDLRIEAPREIFVRGRGLDIELGGGLRVGGTTASPQPVGGIEVIRGGLSIAGKRLQMDSDSRITLSGDLVPFLDLRASTISGDVTVIIRITGPVDNPEFIFESQPPLPQDEVLARLLFGKDIQSLSAFQAAQLAASIRELTGGGGGLLGGVRQGLGLDELNVTTNEEGETEVTAGRYLSDNIYTDVTTRGDGSSEVRLNIDLTDTITVTGSADNDGDTSIGIFYERDY